MTVRALSLDQVRRVLRDGGLAIDLRDIDEYLDKHVRGSIPLLFEAGPGLGSRARDLLPLDARLVLLEDGTSNLEDAAASFRGKGFEVAGCLRGGVDSWPSEEVVATETASRNYPGSTRVFVNVNDPGMIEGGDAAFIPTERLWQRHTELDKDEGIGILSGWGVRAAAAIGILEHLGFTNLTFVRTRHKGEKPPMADSTVFRIGGEP